MLCRLCAKSIETSNNPIEIGELKTKLEVCCGWKSPQNEFEMPQLACNLCVDQLEMSWSFAGSVLMTQEKLAKLLNDNDQLDEVEDTSTIDEITIENFKMETDVGCDVENDEQYSDVTAFDRSTIQSDIEDSFPNERVRKGKKSTKKPAAKETSNSDTFLATLTDEDRVSDGIISSDGVDKLVNLFPEMKNMSWNDCQYECQKCNRIINGPHNYFAHNRSIHIEEMPSMEFYCFYCNFKHCREFGLNKHIANKHFPHLKYRCFYCSDYFWNVQKLIAHRNMHTDVGYKCELCEQIFWGRTILYSHVSQSHLKKKWGNIQHSCECEICGKDFVNKYSIAHHMLQHTKKFDFVCEQCGRKFLTKGSLKGHLETLHRSEKPHPCKQCDKRFKTKYQLSIHLKRHEQYKPLACTVCEKRFRNKQSLSVHMRSHNNTYPYKCKYCERKFKYSNNLKVHQRLHTNEKPYQCNNCEYKSTNWGNLNKHSIRIHSIDLRVKKGLTY